MRNIPETSGVLSVLTRFYFSYQHVLFLLYSFDSVGLIIRCLAGFYVRLLFIDIGLCLISPIPTHEHAIVSCFFFVVCLLISLVVFTLPE